ncbi:IS5 family transposase [Bradyrhizobium sp. ISRA443]|uniref:IS5 family transposase n=1 Tax=unclassified Bradyrhizobium TaxID=2631580 RepID=UPI00247B0DBB|nr:MULTISPECIES: IS5 family transposase [unclassified Bradyrhizobium]WGR97406.1 IS5 family transposase [Bradyrhizobium sp. ISRA436]WGR97528.1 IS5 family transposase [Bradyrhizobium sp. ISRA436]WGR98587.1 IS5 family transposase [Bradyrhizobium sp. ISRA436]WGR98779.1 IS5 family transposase [Bradyrhizobium sp. ISRA436]WGR98870.1 IS5 family transposase [Bradyrhizobium sp. ISRA436]
MAGEFWLNDRQWAAIEPLLPQNQPGARRVDDRRVISGIIHVLKSGCRWRDCPAVFGPYTTVYNRWNRWSRREVWRNLFEALRGLSPDDDFQAIDSTTAKAHRAAAGGKGGRKAQAIGRSRGGRTTKIHAVCDSLGRAIALEVTPGQRGDIRAALPLLSSLPPPRCCAADTAYDANELRQFLIERGTTPVIPNNPTRKRFHPFDRAAYKRRNLVERMFCRLKDWRRIATRYDKLARNFLSAVNLAAAIIWWT